MSVEGIDSLSTFDLLANTFAFPGHTNVPELVSDLSGMVACGALADYISTMPLAYRDGAGEMLDTLQTALTWPGNHQLHWHISLGSLLSVVKNKSEYIDYQKAAASFLLQAGYHGYEVNFHITFKEPCNLNFGLLSILDCEEIKVESNGKLLMLKNGRSTIQFNTIEKSLHFSDDTIQTMLHEYLDIGCGIPIIPPLNLPADPCMYSVPGIKYIDPVSLPSLESLRSAVSIIKILGKKYENWIGVAIRDICLVEKSGSNALSGSAPDWPARVYLSLLDNPVDIIEILVHEAAHQYIHLMRKFSPLHNSGHDKLYYSPIVGRDRPINKILIAFHAIANQLIVLDELNRLKLPHPDLSEHRFLEVADMCKAYTEILNSSSGLSDLGARLYKNLEARVRIIL